jgi:broad specificity phosphatase PhoE
MAMGLQQAAVLAGELAGNNYDGVYASSMIRTQETAGRLASLLDQQIVVMPGLSGDRCRRVRGPIRG